MREINPCGFSERNMSLCHVIIIHNMYYYHYYSLYYFKQALLSMPNISYDQHDEAGDGSESNLGDEASNPSRPDIMRLHDSSWNISSIRQG